MPTTPLRHLILSWKVFHPLGSIIFFTDVCSLHCYLCSCTSPAFMMLVSNSRVLDVPNLTATPQREPRTIDLGTCSVPQDLILNLEWRVSFVLREDFTTSRPTNPLKRTHLSLVLAWPLGHMTASHITDNYP